MWSPWDRLAGGTSAVFLCFPLCAPWVRHPPCPESKKCFCSPLFLTCGLSAHCSGSCGVKGSRPAKPSLSLSRCCSVVLLYSPLPQRTLPVLGILSRTYVPFQFMEILVTCVLQPEYENQKSRAQLQARANWTSVFSPWSVFLINILRDAQHSKITVHFHIRSFSFPSYLPG